MKIDCVWHFLSRRRRTHSSGSVNCPYNSRVTPTNMPSVRSTDRLGFAASLIRQTKTTETPINFPLSNSSFRATAGIPRRQEPKPKSTPLRDSLSSQKSLHLVKLQRNSKVIKQFRTKSPHPTLSRAGRGRSSKPLEMVKSNYRWDQQHTRPFDWTRK